MKRKYVVAMILSALLTVSFTGCQQDAKTEDTNTETSEVTAQPEEETSEESETVTEEPTPTEEPETIDVDTSWYENDCNAIGAGTYIVGEDIKAGSYTYTNKSEYTAHVIIFETLDDYKAYYRTYPRGNGEEEQEAISSNSYYTGYATTDESTGVNISDGNVLMITDGYGLLDNGESVDIDVSDGKVLNEGIYSTDQLEDGTYIISYLDTEEGYNPRAILFADKESYKTYNSIDKFNGEEYFKAMYNNALCDEYIMDESPCTINMKGGRILIIDDSICYIQKIHPAWAVE